MNNFHPLVSIIIPVYNGSNYVKCAIDSALGQDYDNIEVIVVNDGSTDTTEEIAKSYGDKIRYYYKENGGVSNALNFAIINAKGEYISWLSHDDYYLSNKISRQIEELEKITNRDKFIIISNAIIHRIHNGEIINNNETYIKTLYPCYLTKYELLKLLLSWEIHGCTLLIPKNVFKTVGFFDETLKITQDYYLWFKLIKFEYHFFLINEILIITRMHEYQDTNKKWSIAKYEQLNLWNFFKKTFQNEIYEDKKINILLEEKITLFNNAVKEDSFYNILIKKFKKIIPRQIKSQIKTLFKIKTHCI